MTFLELQDAVLNRLNLTSTEARARVKESLNLRYREVQSTLNLARTRRGLVTVTTTSGTATVTHSGIAKLFGLYDDTVRKAPLAERTRDHLLTKAASDDTVGTPIEYAIDQHVNDVIVVRFYPRPNAALALDGDALLAGTDMSDDDDEPTFPVDFHDVLVRGAMADEYAKIGKQRPAALAEEAKFDKRLADLRYFLVKSRRLTTQPVEGGAVGLSGGKRWPYANLA